MPKINQLSKEAIKKGIFKYLIHQDPSFENIEIEVLLSKDLWRSVKNVEPRRQKDIEKILLLLTSLDASHKELHFFIKEYLENIGTGIWGRSKLREFIYEELQKMNPVYLDLQNLRFLQSIENVDAEGRISALLSRIHELEEELITAQMLHQSDQQQIYYLKLQISSLHETMRETQEELATALSVIEQNRQSQKQSESVIQNLLAVLQTKGILEKDEVTQMQPSDSLKKEASSPIPIQRAQEYDSTLDSSRSLMSVCSSARSTATSQCSANLTKEAGQHLHSLRR